MMRAIPAGPLMGLPSWLRSTRASVSVEFVIGSILLLTVMAGGIDLYRIIDARSIGSRAANTMADYISLETAPTGAHLDDLAKFSYQNEITVPSQAAFVVSAIERPRTKGASPVVQWNRKIVVGPDSPPPPAALADTCGRIGSSRGPTTLPTEFAIEPGELVLVVEVCVKLLPQAFVSGGILPDGVFPSLVYQHRIVPVRGHLLPAEPS